ncbi:hybrid sensor histidine kinase/response regulator [Sphingomonas oleivorans]|uniref:histidine kinase n=1 Tax=Sphingomonas oleivorans TaxID=1735121 RepID=A0A2T5FYH2_9SPHN|nr:PAS domain S-box protein [Sphingomonas oleivorans]PTQ11593.1 hybrid sensor histidine kinase/response regulator [Sphingomonas oleivorans]
MADLVSAGRWPSGKSEVASLLRLRDWATSPLGPPEDWPQSLRMIVDLILPSSAQIVLFWGAELVALYNDAYAYRIGAKHPRALARPGAESWAELWDELEPVLRHVLDTGETATARDKPFELERFGYPETAFFDISYSPVRDESGAIAGVLCIVEETTERVVAQERLAFRIALADRLRALSDPLELIGAAEEALGRELGVSRVGYGEMADGDTRFLHSERDWTDDGIVAGPGLHDLDALGPEARDEIRSGRTLVLANAATDPRIPAGRARAALAALDVGAMVMVPLWKRKRMIAAIYVHSRAPRHWSPADISLIEEVAGRTWEAVERARIEAALRESEARFRNMADHAPVMMWLTDANGRCTYLNRAWYEFTGQKEAEAEGLGWLDATHPEDEPMTAGIFRAAVAAQQSFRLEFRLWRASGGYCWAIDAGSPRFGPDGEFLGHVGAVIEIDERRKAEEALAASEAHKRLAIEAARIGTWELRPATGELIWDARCRELFGLGPDAEVTVDSFLAGCVEEDRARMSAAMADAVDPAGSGLIADEYRVIGIEDGVERWLAMRGRATFGTAGCMRFIGVVIDISDQKRAEAELRALNAMLEMQVSERTREIDRIWRNSRDLLVVIGADGIFRAINPAWTATLGHEPEEVVGRSFLDFVWPEDVAMAQAGLDEATVGARTNFEYRYRHKDGSPRWISWRTSHEGDLVYADGRDITAEKAQEEALRQAEDQLRQSHKMEAIGQLTGGVAHDFNNLLTVIRASADLLRRHALPEEKRRRYIDAISDTADRAAKLTGQLLAFARRQALKPETFDVADRIGTLAEMIRTAVGSRVELVLDLDCTVCAVEADASQLDTALVNMAVNARDAMNGAGTLMIRLRAVDRVPGRQGIRPVVGDFVSIAVSDTGEGIAPEALDRIFEPFYTTKGVGKGTGLGLSQVYGFVKQSGGAIQVASEPGRGASFTLYLPRVQGPVAPAGTPPPVAEGRPAEQARILLVEDNAQVGEFATQLLYELGYEPIWTASAEEAMALLETSADSFDIVFSDVVMPGIGGVELGRIVRARWPGLPVVLTSGYSHVLAEEGRNGFELLHKPYSAEDLSRVLRVAARARRAR